MSERVRFFALLGFLALCLLGGGGPRADALSLLYLRPAAIICIAVFLVTRGPWEFRPFKPLFILLGLFAGAMAIQLIPLPPDVWLSLPGHNRYGEAAAAAGLPQPWRPISLTPDLTLNSLLALLPALTVLVGIAGIRADQRAALLPVLLAGVAATVILAVAQVSSSRSSALYLYAVTHDQAAVGLFANRNHQAALLAMAFPMLRMWTLGRPRNRQFERVRFWIAIGFGCVLVPAILVTGSKAGVALGLVGLGAAVAIAPPRLGGAWPAWKQMLLVAILLAIPIALVSAAILLGRAEALDRLNVFSENYMQEQRIENTPLMLRMAADFFPFGSGFGSFDPVFRGYEPDERLTLTYFNHAHNEAIELVLTGGLAALLVLALFLGWLFRRTIIAFFRPRNGTHATHLARLGSTMVMMTFIASLVDYPLRTPLFGAIFAIACGWLAAGTNRALPSFMTRRS